MNRGDRRGRIRKALAWTALAAVGFLAFESALPARLQPSAKLGVLLIRGYQAVGSPVLKAGGVQCRYAPTCSHYAADAIEANGTVIGSLKAAGRLFRCSPWGGSGWDPAVASVSSFQNEAPQETPEQKRQREQFQKDMKEFEKAMKDAEPAIRDAGVACGFAGLTCVLVTVGGLAITIFVMVWVYKDARARGDQNAAIWLVLIFFLSWIGLIIYVVARPKGNLTPCPNCRNSRLETLSKCPICGADTGAAKA